MKNFMLENRVIAHLVNVTGPPKTECRVLFSMVRGTGNMLGAIPER